ncbi:MAG: hypothetical protein PF487_04015 [Bacteroidales bacterium]|jgi:hypothetical protein|nr:hypothetical protein [Bacteroidales bacterium]
MNSRILGNYLEDFEVRAVIRHSLSKTIFESDNNIFSLVAPLSQLSPDTTVSDNCNYDIMRIN